LRHCSSSPPPSGSFAYARIAHLQEVSASVTQRSLPTITVLGQIRSLVKENFINALRHALTDDKNVRQFSDIEAAMKQISEDTTAQYKQLDGLLSDDQDRAAMERITAARAPYTKLRVEVLKQGILR